MDLHRYTQSVLLPLMAVGFHVLMERFISEIDLALLHYEAILLTWSSVVCGLKTEQQGTTAQRQAVSTLTKEISKDGKIAIFNDSKAEGERSSAL